MSGEVVLFADLHCHPYKPYADIDDTGMNSRVKDAVACLEQITRYCEKNKPDLVLFAGDMFHTRGKLSVQAYNAVHNVLEELGQHTKLVMIHGNHDQVDRGGADNSLEGLRHVCTVPLYTGWHRVGANNRIYDIFCIPYSVDDSAVRTLIRDRPVAHRKIADTALLLGHVGIQGAKLGADFVFPSPYDLTLDDLNLPEFDAAFLGHYHMHQQLAPNCWYIGAPMHHTWGDKGQRRGFMTYDVNTKMASHIELEFPQFVEIPTGQFNAPVGSYVKMQDTVSWAADVCEEVRTKHGWRSFEVVPVPSSAPKSHGPRLPVSVGMSMSDVLVKYVRSGLVTDPNLDEDYLLQLGQELLQLVEEAT